MFTRILFAGIVGMALTVSAGANAAGDAAGGKAVPDRFVLNTNARHFGDRDEDGDQSGHHHRRCQGYHHGCGHHHMSEH